ERNDSVVPLQKKPGLNWPGFLFSGDVFVGEDGLHVDVFVEGVVEFFQGLGGGGVNGHGGRRDVGDLGALGLDAGGVERGENFVEDVHVAAQFVAVVGGDDVVGAGFEADLHEL